MRRFTPSFIGSGILAEEIARRAAESPCAVRVLGRVQKSYVSAILKVADVGYCGLADRPTL